MAHSHLITKPISPSQIAHVALKSKDLRIDILRNGWNAWRRSKIRVRGLEIIDLDLMHLFDRMPRLNGLWIVMVRGIYKQTDSDVYTIEYFEAVADALLSAKSEIYIEDWWLVRW